MHCLFCNQPGNLCFYLLLQRQRPGSGKAGDRPGQWLDILDIYEVTSSHLQSQGPSPRSHVASRIKFANLVLSWRQCQRDKSPCVFHTKQRWNFYQLHSFYMISRRIKQFQMLKTYKREKGVIFYLIRVIIFPLKSIHIKWGAQRNNNYFQKF